VRRAAKVDSNHREILEALREVGALVVSTAAVGMGFPDLCVGYRDKNYLLEVKGPKGELNPLQRALHGMWTGQMCVVRSVDDALRAIGAVR
jgi:hypothetical protein